MKGALALCHYMRSCIYWQKARFFGQIPIESPAVLSWLLHADAGKALLLCPHLQLWY